MKKFLLVLVFCLGFIGGVFAQMSFTRPFDKTISLGVKGGINTPRMLYFNNPSLMRLPQSFVFTPTGGLFLDVPITADVVFAPEVVYVQRGINTKYIHHPTGAMVHYSISTHYVDLRLPLELNWQVSPWFQPFVTVGVEAGMCLSGKIHLDRHKNLSPLFDIDTSRYHYSQYVLLDNTIPVDSANMFLIHAGAVAGVGIRSKVSIGYQNILLKLNVSYHQGFVDTYSSSEKSGDSQSLNVNAYQITGRRLPQGMEITLGVAIPLKPWLKDACATFANDRYYRRSNRGHLFGY